MPQMEDILERIRRGARWDSFKGESRSTLYRAARARIDVPSVESMEGGSKFNSLESEVVGRVLGDLLEAGVPAGSVGVITPYRAQVKAIKALLPKRGFEVNTVDSYQGREKEVIVFSATGTHDMEFVEDVNRLNVALTRARRKLIVVGNSESLGLRRGLLGKYLDHAASIQCAYRYSDGVIRVLESPLIESKKITLARAQTK